MVRDVLQPERKRKSSRVIGNIAKKKKSQSEQLGSLVARVVGVDFSGSSTDAGKLILVAECKLFSERDAWTLVVDRVRSVNAMSGNVEKNPTEACKVLRAALLGLKTECLNDVNAKPIQLIVGVDSPPSVAAQFISPLSWRDWAKTFSARYPAPEAFRTATTHIPPKALAAESKPKLPSSSPSLKKVKKTPPVTRKFDSMATAVELEPKRETDILAKVPFAPQNLRMFRQTYHAIAGLYGPLVDEFTVVPCGLRELRGNSLTQVEKPLKLQECPAVVLKACRENQALLFESCPASVLKRLGLYKPPYKSKGQKMDAAAHEAAFRRRQQLLKILEKGVATTGTGNGVLKVVFPDVPLRHQLVDDAGADALDAVLAAVGAACATRSPKFPSPSDGCW
eukprot:CAMPEP_0172825778 /NCGR_PEP_ID=MMETSP1075-20121228/18924_1 /TAXON_ID=2916 /ORGANISM="Ceratium fusus, Strain PA161109" /LENGTH=394 /DNA_ID=CAMNT_0013667279 /DNA_START=108 /DNA_END=1289 /DNA_ORIENTATION=+